MLLIVEIALTAWACVRYSQAKKNWLLGIAPIGVGLIVAFLVGLLLGALSASAATITIIGVMIDIGIIVALISAIATNKPA